MSNKCIRPIKTIVIFTTRLTLRMANTSSSTYFEITRVAMLNIVTFYCDGVGLFTSTLKWVSPNKMAILVGFAEQDGYFSSFLPTMASNRTSMNYNRELFSRIAEFITYWPCTLALKHTDSGLGQNFTPYQAHII